MAGCGSEPDTTTGGADPDCDPDNGGLTLPDGFCARIVADNIGFLRQVAVDDHGHIYAAQRNIRLGLGGLLLVGNTVADSDSEGHYAGEVVSLLDDPGMGLAIHDGWLYFGADTAIYRYRLPQQGVISPDTKPELLITFPEQDEHAGKMFTFDDEGYIYVNVAAPSNACQEENLVPGSPGLDPCPELENHAAIWRFPLDRTNQYLTDGDQYAGGIRNAYALAWRPADRQLYAVQHGRVQLHELWPDIFTPLQNAELPAEEFLQIEQGQMYAWPYCYFDHYQDRLVLAPEYGGDGSAIGHCAGFPKPLFGFPAHYGPNDMLFYTGDQFPARYRQGAFIAFHGSHDRGELQQVGYQVVFAPFAANGPDGTWEVFADGFAGPGPVHTPADAEFRPTGVSMDAAGNLYVSDSVQGRIWRIRYTGTETTD